MSFNVALSEANWSKFLARSALLLGLVGRRAVRMAPCCAASFAHWGMAAAPGPCGAT